MKRIVILYGGKSGEHEVSLNSGASIVRNIDRKAYVPILVGIARDGSWHLQDEGAADRALASQGPLALATGTRVLVAPGRGLLVERNGGVEPLPCDLVFPVLHGTFGEDGTIQGLLEVADLPYVGAPVLGSALGMDKEKAKELWTRLGLPVLPYVIVRGEDLPAEGAPGAEAAEAALRVKIGARLGWPVFVKPVCAGSSVGASKVAAAERLVPALREALAWDEKAIVEPFVEARELECSVLGNERPVAYAPGEIVPSHEFYDYEAKYIDPDGARLVIPAQISQEQIERVRSIAIAAYRACELAGMARADFFLDKRSGEIILNEVNTIPGFTSISMYPKMCEAGGLPYTELISRLAELALERHARRARLRYSR
jgi:D-alanine-D-alanine ligase